MRTYAYIDGFNLYYGALKDTAFKWLDLGVLIPLMLGHKHDVACIKYFTAKVKVSETDPRQSERQETYLRALREPREGIPPVEIHFGHFQRRSTRMPRSPFGTGWVEVIKTEEKGSDVNPNVAINVVCHAAFSRYFKDLMVGIAVLFNLTCGESERQSKIDTRSCEIGDLPTIG